MKIRFSPQMLIEMMRSDNPPKLTLGKLYKVRDEFIDYNEDYYDNGEILVLIKDDNHVKLCVPKSEEGVLFEYVKEEEDD